MSSKISQRAGCVSMVLPDVLDVEQAAQFLGISKLSMYKLIRNRKKRVPVKTVAGAFKISKRQLLEWFESL